MSKHIEFIAVHDYAWEFAEKPYPAIQSLPRWWKDMNPYIVSDYNPTGKKFVMEYQRGNGTPRKCMPMMDAMTSGYIIPLWADIQVRSTSDSEYEPRITWKASREVFESHVDGAAEITPPSGFAKDIFKFINLWCVRTPKGYSSRISSPVGHYDLPFHCMDAIVDTDKYDAALPTPMFLKEGFEGIIERGTPMIQVTPFKRENWESDFSKYGIGEHEVKHEKWLRLNSRSNYIKTQWSKKTYK